MRRLLTTLAALLLCLPLSTLADDEAAGSLRAKYGGLPKDQARRFYEAMGYEADGATKQVDLGAPFAAVRYRKSLKDAE
jgi:ABC-type sugar transport system substrate-binding protein